MHSRCAARVSVCTGISRTRVAQVNKGCASQNIHTSSLRSMSHALTHFTPSTCTPSSPVLVPRSLIHCEDPLLAGGGASPELPPPTNSKLYLNCTTWKFIRRLSDVEDDSEVKHRQETLIAKF